MSSWIKTTDSGLSYELGVNGEKKLMETGILLIKNEHSTFHTGKPGNFGAIALSYPPLLLLMTHHEKTRLKVLP